jgi:catalase
MLYDNAVVPCGPESVQTLQNDGYAAHFVAEAYNTCDSEAL